MPILARLMEWLRDPVLSPRPAAALGGGAGLVVGLMLALSMRRHAFFTSFDQPYTAGALLVLIWTAIGIVAGLAVLAPAAPEPADDMRADGA